MTEAAPKPRVHPTHGECNMCGAKLTEPIWIEFGDGLPPIPVTKCNQCIGALRADDERRRLTYWVDSTPLEFQKPWDDTVGNNALLKRVLSFDARQRRGMVISGESGRCKTRVTYQLMRKLTLLGIGWRVVRAASFVDAKVPEGSFGVEVLALDDFGNELTAPGIDRQLLNLISARCDANRPTIITSQHTPETFVQRYPGQASLAIIRRLGEFCDYINANTKPEPKHEQRGLQI